MCVGRKKIYYQFLSELVLLLGIAIPFFLMRYSINFSDEPYQILNAMDYHQNPATIFSTYIYHLLGEICGYRLLTMRAFMAIFSIITVFVPTLYFYFNRRNVLEAMIVGGLALLLLSIIQQKSTLVGWDILSNLTLTI